MLCYSILHHDSVWFRFLIRSEGDVGFWNPESLEGYLASPSAQAKEGCPPIPADQSSTAVYESYSMSLPALLFAVRDAASYVTLPRAAVRTADQEGQTCKAV